MILTDYFKSEHDLTWDYAKQCGVEYGVIRLPEDDRFDICDYSHWKSVYKRFSDFGITPLVIEPMPNELHDPIKIGDEKRDACIEKVIKMMQYMNELDIRTICFNWMAYISAGSEPPMPSKSAEGQRLLLFIWTIFESVIRRSRQKNFGIIMNIL